MRRPKGTGTIEKRADGLYRARFAFVPGQREEIAGSPFANRESAQAALDGLLAELADNGALQGGITVKKLGERALNRREKEGYRSVDSERSRWAAYVEFAELGQRPARCITRGDVREWLAGLAAKGLATQTRRNALNLLRAVLATGVDDETLEENVAVGIKVKDRGATKEKSTFLTIEETTKLLAVATDPAVAIAVGTGMRSGELRSLRWEDVHLASKPHVVVRYGAPDEPTKNGRIRNVPLFGVALAAFKRLKKGRDKECPVVLPSLSGYYRQKGRVVEPEDWAVWKKAAGISRRVRWHDLRHTCATLLLTGAWGGEPWSYEAVKDMLGHSSVKVTERYARSATLATQAAEGMKRGKRKPQTSPKEEDSVRAKALEIVGRRGSDSNRRMTVLQSQHRAGKNRCGADLWGLFGAYVSAVAQDSPHAHARGLDLAEGVLDVLLTNESPGTYAVTGA